MAAQVCDLLHGVHRCYAYSWRSVSLVPSTWRKHDVMRSVRRTWASCLTGSHALVPALPLGGPLRRGAFLGLLTLGWAGLLPCWNLILSLLCCVLLELDAPLPLPWHRGDLMDFSNHSAWWTGGENMSKSNM